MTRNPCLFRFGFVAASVIASLAGTPAAAQCTWLLGSAGIPKEPLDPPIRQNHAAVFDTVRNQVVVFGGFLGGFGSYGDTWTWNGADWTQASISGPSVRSVHAMAWDAARGRVVLFGGNAGGALGDTWEWDGTTWTEIFPATSPPARFNHAMAFDSVRNVVVLAGGFGTVRYNDTWEFSGGNWTQRVGITNFTGRNGHGMEFDPGRNKMVIFGGFNGARLNDTWELGATGWTLIPVTGPSGRQYLGGLTFNPDDGLIYLFGGQTGPATADRVNDLWSYDGTAWTLAIPGVPSPDPVPPTMPNRRDQHTTTYDRARHQIVVFGGYQGATLGGVAPNTWLASCGESCYADCDGVGGLTANDFACFLTAYANGASYANCDGVGGLTANDFACFLNAYAAGCP
jgi:hypothetical protein